MFRGLSSLVIDSKHRLAIPSRYRECLSEQGGCLVLTLNPMDAALWLYPLSEWESIENKLKQLSDFNVASRRTKQVMLGCATDCHLDGQGRILVQQQLREHASLQKQVVVLGQGNRFEIWNGTTWNKQYKQWLASTGDDSSEVSNMLESLSL